jgi:hypothetical protein
LSDAARALAGDFHKYVEHFEMTFTPILWDEKYATGIEEIDLQHRYFLRLIIAA